MCTRSKPPILRAIHRNRTQLRGCSCDLDDSGTPGSCAPRHGRRSARRNEPRLDRWALKVERNEASYLGRLSSSCGGRKRVSCRMDGTRAHSFEMSISNSIRGVESRNVTRKLKILESKSISPNLRSKKCTIVREEELRTPIVLEGSKSPSWHMQGRELLPQRLWENDV